MRSEGRREPWPWILAALLLSMMSVSLTFYAVAASNPDAVVVDDAYQAGLRYNEALRAQQRAEALGYRVDLTLDTASDAVRVEVVLRDAAGRAVEPEAVSVRRVRPTLGGFDADFELNSAEEGFAGSIPLPLPGRWQLVTSARIEGETLVHKSALRTAGR